MNGATCCMQGVPEYGVDLYCFVMPSEAPGHWNGNAERRQCFVLLFVHAANKVIAVTAAFSAQQIRAQTFVTVKGVV